MKAGVASESGLVVRDVPQPRPKPNEVLVKVKAASLNRADLTTARGLPHGSHGGVGAPVGIDWAGEVVETGAEVQGGFKPGDRVMCSGSGGYAEYAVSDWGRVNPMPSGMSFEDAATLPVALMTLHNALITAGRHESGRERDDPGRELRRRADGPADRQAQGRQAGHRLVHQRWRAARASRSSAPISWSTPATRPGPSRCSRRPTARASISWSTCCRGRWWRRP